MTQSFQTGWRILAAALLPCWSYALTRSWNIRLRHRQSTPTSRFMSRRHVPQIVRRDLTLASSSLSATGDSLSTFNATMSASSTMQQDSTDDDKVFELWQVGNVYDDLDRLERAIAFHNADQHLRQVEDRERLDTMAKQRRVVDNDVQKFILAPLALSFALTAVYRWSEIGRLLVNSLFACNNLQYWIIIVMAPLWMLASKRRSLPKQQPMPPPELQGLDPDYYQFVVTDWQDPKKSCRDHVLCLLEQWSSAVVGAILAGIAVPLGMRWAGIARLPGMMLSGYVAQFVTRLGAIASLHQYPKLLYELWRQHQPRPMDRHTIRLQKLAKWAIWSAPTGVALDIAQVLSRLPPLSAGILGAWTGSTALKYWLFGRRRKRSTPRPVRRHRAIAESLVGASLTGTQVLGVITLASLVVQRLVQYPIARVSTSRANARLLLLAHGLWFISYIFAPICHLLAIKKLFRFAYTHDVSLATDYETMAAILSNPKETERRFRHRYRLEWREPERLAQTLSNWKGGLPYWLLFEGGVEDQLRKEFQANQKGEAYKRGLSVLQRCQEDMKKNPTAPRATQSEWKKKAMERIAAKHEADYNSGKLDDPLGVAVQQTFGIGLGYNFDHMSELKPGEAPSTRRLQARAAKSAIRRAQEIYDSKAVQKELDSIADPTKREQKRAELRRASQEEIQYLAKRLSELVPTDFSMDPSRQTQVKQFIQRDYKRTSDHEMVMESPIDKSDSLDSLLGRERSDPLRDDEFLEAWLRRQAQDDGDESVALV